MKFGHTLDEAEKLRPDWAAYYLEYRRLKAILTAMQHACKGLAPVPASTGAAASQPAPRKDGGVRGVAAMVKNMETAFIAMLEEVCDAPVCRA